MKVNNSIFLIASMIMVTMGSPAEAKPVPHAGEITDAHQKYCMTGTNWKERKCQDDKGALKILIDKGLIPAEALGGGGEGGAAQTNGGALNNPGGNGGAANTAGPKAGGQKHHGIKGGKHGNPPPTDANGGGGATLDAGGAAADPAGAGDPAVAGGPALQGQDGAPATESAVQNVPPATDGANAQVQNGGSAAAGGGANGQGQNGAAGGGAENITDAHQKYCMTGTNWKERKCQDDKGALKILVDKGLIPAAALQG